MSFAQFIPNFQVVEIKSTWATAANILADIEAAWSIDFGTANTYAICVWEGPADPDDYARYTITAGTLTIADGFDSTPDVGTLVYIMDFYWS